MKTKSWSGSVDSGFIEDVLTLSSKIKIKSDKAENTFGLIYAVYVMQSMAEQKIFFTAYDEDNNEIAMYNKDDDKIVAKGELHEAISSMYFIIHREKGVLRAELIKMLESEYGLKISTPEENTLNKI